jgi:hypothetical protein
MDDFSRTEFDKAVLAAFPHAHKTREEHTYGWTDTIDLNLLKIRIRVYTEDQRRMKRGQVMVELHGMRSTLDGSTVLLSHRQVPWERLGDALVTLGRDLLGLAAAITMMTGVDGPRPKDPLDSKTLWSSNALTGDDPFDDIPF